MHPPAGWPPPPQPPAPPPPARLSARGDTRADLHPHSHLRHPNKGGGAGAGEGVGGWGQFPSSIELGVIRYKASTLTQKISEALHKNRACHGWSEYDDNWLICGHIIWQKQTYTVTYAPTVTDPVFMRRFRLFSGQCVALNRHWDSVPCNNIYGIGEFALLSNLFYWSFQ